MKLLISWGNFERLCAGLSPVEQARLADQVDLYPDDVAPAVEADQRRIGDRYQQLLGGTFRVAGVVSDVQLPAPWEQATPGLWIAPAGTPPPGTPLPGPAPPTPPPVDVGQILDDLRVSLDRLTGERPEPDEMCWRGPVEAPEVHRAPAPPGSPAADDPLDTARQVVDDLAGELDVPRNLLNPSEGGG